MSNLRKGMPYFAVALACVGTAILSPQVFATTGGVGDIAGNVKGNLSGLAELVTAISYLMGGVFGLLGLVKLYGYSQNPQQVQGGLKVPIVLLFLAGALVYFPSVITSSGSTIFGGSQQTQGIEGTDNFTGQ